MNRKEKEQLYILKMTELQRIWGNAIDDDWEHVKEFTDIRLDQAIKDTIGQISFEKSSGFIGGIVKFVIFGFVGLGIIGLLAFGIRQLF